MAADPLIATLADELTRASADLSPIEPFTDRSPDLVHRGRVRDPDPRDRAAASPGRQLIGRKIGLTSQPMQQMLGVDEPDFGVLLDDMFVEDGDEIPLGTLLQPRVEAELAFVMDRDLAGPGVTTANALTAVAGCCRPSRWSTAGSPTGGSSLSTRSPTTPRPGCWCGRTAAQGDRFDLRLIGVVVSRNGEMIDTGAGAAALGNPARCVAWLANKLATLRRRPCGPATWCCPARCTGWCRSRPATCSAPSSPSWAR